MTRSTRFFVQTSVAIVLCLALSAWTRHKVYDPDRDPARDLAVAKVEAAQHGKKILLSLGGNWCSWCLAFDRFLQENPSVKQHWDDAFVTVKVNISDENPNEKFLAGYPRVSALPLFLVLNSDGALVSQQRTGVLEDGKTYSQDRVLEFVRQWRAGEANSLKLAKQE
jgi:thioredoxin-related protein